MNQLDQQIGRRLRNARRACGYRSARAFATKYQVPESTYSQHETGKRSLSPELMIFYAKCLGLNPGWLLTGPDEALQQQSYQLKNQALAKVEPLPMQMGIQDIDLFKRLYDSAAAQMFNEPDCIKLKRLFEAAVDAYMETRQVA